MKNISPLALIKTAALMAVFSSVTLRAAETNTAPVRIGTYDSRAVAFAWFWSDAHQRQLQEFIRTAQAAKAAGDTNRFTELAASLRQQQDEIHREGFSIAPPTEALAEIKDRLPEIQRAAGVIDLVSKWDDATLIKYSAAEKVDVTERLVREFHPTDKQLKTITSIEKSEPLSLQKCEELIRKGEI
jgi:hypothetical protein